MMCIDAFMLVLEFYRLSSYGQAEFTESLEFKPPLVSHDPLSRGHLRLEEGSRSSERTQITGGTDEYDLATGPPSLLEKTSRRISVRRLVKAI